MKTITTQILAVLALGAYAQPAAAAEKKEHDHEHKHEHRKVVPGPNGGRVLTDVKPYLEFLVAKQTGRNAALYGLGDRGIIEPGTRADLNVIDLDSLNVGRPRAHADLPGGGTRLIQPVSGYVATVVDGVPTRLDDADTGARPGRLVRSLSFTSDRGRRSYRRSMSSIQ